MELQFQADGTGVSRGETQSMIPVNGSNPIEWRIIPRHTQRKCTRSKMFSAIIC